MPLLRSEDRANIVSHIPEVAFEAIEKEVRNTVNQVSQKEQKLGDSGNGPELQGSDLTWKKVTGRGVMRIAAIATAQVNHPDFNGTIQMNGDLMKRSIMKIA